MSIAIIRTGGKQFTVEPGSTVRVPSLKDEVGTSVDLEVLAVGEGKETKVGSPLVEGANVTATIVDHGRAPKIVVFKKKRRKQYKRTKGHRQGYTTLKIDSIG
ncbi:MAG TPA: 50S ribosomal protein L21 [Pyrinomonadaceae bacterium]|jgi:large subunit ribosomal protein L21|nr:50S ribosomal protein L21 [Pyrinomonadaceae bacterium]